MKNHEIIIDALSEKIELLNEKVDTASRLAKIENQEQVDILNMQIRGYWSFVIQSNIDGMRSMFFGHIEKQVSDYKLLSDDDEDIRREYDQVWGLKLILEKNLCMISKYTSKEKQVSDKEIAKKLIDDIENLHSPH